MKKLSLLLSLLLLFSFVSNVLAEDTIKIGALAPLTGDVAQYGIAVKEGVDLYIDEINKNGGVLGKKVEVLWEDEKGDIQEAINAFNKLVFKDDVVAIIGDVTSKPTIAVSEYAKDEGIPMITASSTATEVTEGKDNVFRACFLDDFQAITMANYAHEVLGLKKYAIIYDIGDDFSVGISESFKKQVEANGDEVVAYVSGTATDVDFKAQLTNIKQAGPDALFVSFYYKEASNIMKQSLEVGLDNVTLLSGDGMNGIETMLPDNKDLLSRLLYTDHFAADADTPEVKKFNEDFNAKYGKLPYSAFNATAYDAALILCNAIEKAGTTEYADVVNAMKTNEVVGVTGKLRFDEKNNPIKSAFIMSFVDGKEVFKHQQNPN